MYGLPLFPSVLLLAFGVLLFLACLLGNQD